MRLSSPSCPSPPISATSSKIASASFEHTAGGGNVAGRFHFRSRRCRFAFRPDAPDLLSPVAPETKPGGPIGHKNERLNGGQRHAKVRQDSASHRAKSSATSSRQALEPKASVALREQLTAELKDISSADEAANWADRVMAAKNRLMLSDAEHVERAFQERLVSITNQAAAPSIPNAEPPLRRPGRKDRRRRSAIDKSVLALPAPRRLRDRDHVKSVAKQPCLVCGRRPADAHHLRFAQSPALGRKVSDEFTVPLPGASPRGARP